MHLLQVNAKWDRSKRCWSCEWVEFKISPEVAHRKSCRSIEQAKKYILDNKIGTYIVETWIAKTDKKPRWTILFETTQPPYFQTHRRNFDTLNEIRNHFENRCFIITDGIRNQDFRLKVIQRKHIKKMVETLINDTN